MVLVAVMEREYFQVTTVKQFTIAFDGVVLNRLESCIP